RGAYPASVLPWQRLSERGARVPPLRPASGLLSGTELAAAIGPRTRLLAVTWVDSFTGRALDLHELGAVCRRAGVMLVVNASQALGARPIDVQDAPVRCGGVLWLQMAVRPLWHRIHLAPPGTARTTAPAAGVLAGNASRAGAG